MYYAYYNTKLQFTALSIYSQEISAVGTATLETIGNF